MSIGGRALALSFKSDKSSGKETSSSQQDPFISVNLEQIVFSLPAITLREAVSLGPGMFQELMTISDRLRLTKTFGEKSKAICP